jgi:metallo-beta-lactamase family protein
LRLRNWAPFPIGPASIDAVILTHAHLDHTGYLPALIRDGYAGSLHTSHATEELCGILLPDSAYLQEKDADYANRKGFSKHKPARPLYTVRDAGRALERFSAVPFDAASDVLPGWRMLLRKAGHILGAAIVELSSEGRKIVFSGDLGRYGDPVMVDPAPVSEADYLVIESTYGDRLHDASDPESVLAEIVERTVSRGGTVVIPAFAVGRAQSLLYHIERIKAAGRLRHVPVFLDSPMAVDASDIFCRHLDDHKLSAAQCKAACQVAEYVREAEDSKALTANPMPKIIISASGMATGGRVLHHLKRYAADPNSAILLAGFQAAGTRGAAMLAGTREIKIHGEIIPVRAAVKNLSMLSAHADANEILRWLRGFRQPPKMTFITHGEPAAASALRMRIVSELGWPCHIPVHGERVTL